MADTSSNSPTSMATSVPTRATSKIALLIAFAAGAAFSWIIMEVANQDQDSVATTVRR